MAEIRLTRRAVSDLMEVEEESIQAFGQIVADKYMDDIEDALKTLSEFPIFCGKSHLLNICAFLPRADICWFLPYLMTRSIY